MEYNHAENACRIGLVLALIPIVTSITALLAFAGGPAFGFSLVFAATALANVYMAENHTVQGDTATAHGYSRTAPWFVGLSYLAMVIGL